MVPMSSIKLRGSSPSRFTTLNKPLTVSCNTYSIPSFRHLRMRPSHLISVICPK